MFGEIGALELQQLVRELGQYEMDTMELALAVAILDADGSGQIEYAEFIPIAAEIIQALQAREEMENKDAACNQDWPWTSLSTTRPVSRTASASRPSG